MAWTNLHTHIKTRMPSEQTPTHLHTPLKSPTLQAVTCMMEPAMTFPSEVNAWLPHKVSCTVLSLREQQKKESIRNEEVSHRAGNCWLAWV